MTPAERDAAIDFLTRALVAGGVSEEDAVIAAPALIDRRPPGPGFLAGDYLHRDQELAGTISGQVDLGWQDEARDSRGRWTKFGGVGDAVKIMEKEREGFSVSPQTGEAPQHGFMVALDGHTHRYPAAILDDPARLHKAIDDMLMSEKSSFQGKDMYLGGWVEDGKLWLDPSQNVPDQATAEKLGKARDQVGIFDLDTFNTINTGGSGGGRIIDHASTA
jgi:hypothetical protein